MNNAKRLRLWAGKDDEMEHVPRPTPGDVLYTAQNPDRTRKRCANCFLWKAKAQECVIHDPTIIVAENMVCGYHVFGKPQEHDIVAESLDPVTPENSGLIVTEDGVSCDSCSYFRSLAQLSGLCIAVADPDTAESDFVVEALGCCARWRKAT